MKILTTSPFEKVLDLLVVPAFPSDQGGITTERDQALGGAASTAFTQKTFTGAKGDALLLLSGNKVSASWVALVGLGEKPIHEENWRVAGAAAARATGEFVTVGLDLRGFGKDIESIAEAIVTGYLLACYRFGEGRAFAKPAPAPRITLFVDDDKTAPARRGALRGEALAHAQSTARDIGNLPGNQGTPTEIAKRAKDLAKRRGLTIKVLDEKRMEALKMGSLLSVSKGSAEPARLCVLEYAPEKAKRTVCLVGKGVTFDTGGISIKPSANLEKMRHDKCGAAAVLGAMEAIATQKLPLRVIGIIGCVENMPGSAATRPGDVVTAMDGTTIEVINTDAEGRLVLADALLYAQQYKPELIIDLATLTGACVVALGAHHAGMLGTDEKNMAALASAGRDTGEKVWQLPLAPEYASAMKGTTTDLKNLGGRDAGAITAAEFLKPFAGDFPWIHLDIAGCAWDDSTRPYNPKSGASGFGVRLLTRFLSAF